MKKVGKNHLGSWARYLNPYSLVMMDALYENQRKEGNGRRVYMLTRSGFAGQQRTGATTWSGDIGASWDIYRKQIAAGVNFSMSGQPYWTFDIGAFVICELRRSLLAGRQGPRLPGALHAHVPVRGLLPDLPLARIGDAARDLGVRRVLRHAREVRSPALPPAALHLLAGLAGHARGLHDHARSAGGLPADKKTHGVDDQFMFGPAFMASPVTEYQLHRPPEDSVLVPDAEPPHAGREARASRAATTRTRRTRSSASSGWTRTSTSSGTRAGPTT